MLSTRLPSVKVLSYIYYDRSFFFFKLMQLVHFVFASNKKNAFFLHGPVCQGLSRRRVCIFCHSNFKYLAIFTIWCLNTTKKKFPEFFSPYLFSLAFPSQMATEVSTLTGGLSWRRLRLELRATGLRLLRGSLRVEARLRLRLLLRRLPSVRDPV